MYILSALTRYLIPTPPLSLYRQCSFMELGQSNLCENTDLRRNTEYETTECYLTANNDSVLCQYNGDSPIVQGFVILYPDFPIMGSWLSTTAFSHVQLRWISLRVQWWSRKWNVRRAVRTWRGSGPQCRNFSTPRPSLEAPQRSPLQSLRPVLQTTMTLCRTMTNANTKNKRANISPWTHTDDRAEELADQPLGDHCVSIGLADERGFSWPNAPENVYRWALSRNEQIDVHGNHPKLSTSCVRTVFKCLDSTTSNSRTNVDLCAANTGTVGCIPDGTF